MKRTAEERGAQIRIVREIRKIADRCVDFEVQDDLEDLQEKLNELLTHPLDPVTKRWAYRLLLGVETRLEEGGHA